MAFKKSNKTNDEIKYEVIEECGTISTNGDWELKLRYMSWNGNDPKYDLRPWNTETGRCAKGIGLTGEQLESLFKILKEMA